MKQLLFIVSILMLMALSSCDFFKSKKLFNKNNEDTTILQLRQDSAEFVDSIRTLKQDLQSLKSKHARMLDSLKQKKVQETPGYKYHIIVGSFRTEQYLNSYNKYIRDKGFSTNILTNEYGFKMISVESYKSWSQAATALENIRQDVEENSWIYIRS